MKIFRLHILPVLLALLIIVSGGGLMFLAMRFGLVFQDRIIVRDDPDAGIPYSEGTPQKLTEMDLWMRFEKADKKSLSEFSPDDSDDEAGIVLSHAEETVSILARYFLGRMTTAESDISVDISGLRYAVIELNRYGYIYNEDHALHAIGVDGCVLSLDNEGKQFKVRYMYNCADELLFFDFENPGEDKYTVDDVNNAYKNISGELWFMVKNTYDVLSPYSLLYDLDIINKIYYMEHGTESSGNYSRIEYFENFRIYKPISYFLAIYGIMDTPNSYAASDVKNNIYTYFNNYLAQTVYSDGYIYVIIDGGKIGGIALKYSVADACVTGMTLIDY